MRIRWDRIAITFALMLSGCATIKVLGHDYSTCLKNRAPAALHELELAAPTQVVGILETGLSASWVAAGLQALTDAGKDIYDFDFVIMCAVSAWQQAHPLTPSASPSVQSAHQGAQQFMAKRASLMNRMALCGAVATLDIPPTCSPVADATDSYSVCREIRVTGPEIVAAADGGVR